MSEYGVPTWYLGYGAEVVPADCYTPHEDCCELCGEVLGEEAWEVFYRHDTMGIACRECVSHEVEAYEKLQNFLHIRKNK